MLLLPLTATGHRPELTPRPPDPQTIAVRQNAQSRTLDLLTASHALVAAGAAGRARAVANLVAAAKSRHDAILDLLARDPAEARRVMLPAQLRSNLPAQAAAYVEQDVDEDGTFEVAHADYVDPALNHYEYGLTTAQGKLSLYFADKAPEMQSGSHVKVHGLRLDSALLADSSTSVTTTKAATTGPLPGTLGAQRTLTILVNFTDDTSQPFTVASAQSTMFTTVSNYWYEASYQQTTLTGDVAGWFTIPVSTTTCDTSSIATYARQAAQAAGYNLANYARFLYAFPGSSCTWWGYSMIGGTPSQSWVAAKYGFNLVVIGHELGHALGLYHSHSLDCASVSIAASGCTASEYGDYFDIMGGGNWTPHYNAFQKEQLGWLNAGASPPITPVPTSGSATYTLEAIETARDTAPRALKIARSAACGTSSDYFYVEAREPLGYDSFLSTNTNVVNGVLVHDETPGSPNSSYLLDMTPATTSWTDAALDGGITFTDPGSGLTITPLTVGGALTTVNVTYPTSSCTHAAPSVTLTPTGTEYTSAGSTASYTVSVTNNDSCGCASSAFNVSASVPAGWGATKPQTPTLAPGTTGSTSLTISTAPSATAAYYTIPSTAANASVPTYATTADATVAIVAATTAASTSVAVATNQASYTRPAKTNQTVYAVISTTVMTGGAPVSGASVSVTITNPKGSATTLSTATGSSGVASVSYPIKSKSVAGTYSVKSTATANGTSASAMMSFGVD